MEIAAKRLLIAIVLVLGFSATAYAAPCPPMPFIFQQGAPFNAPQVNTDFGHLRDCINTNDNVSGPVNPYVPGVVGDGSTDNCAALTSYIASHAITGRMTLTLPTGVFLSSCSLTFNNVSASIRGDGAGVTEIVFSAGNGLVFNTALNNMVDISNIALTTFQVNANSAVKVSYTAAGFNNRDTTKLTMRDVMIKGTNQTTQSWNKCLELIDVNGVMIDHLDCFGIQGALGTAGNAQADNTVTAYGITIAGTNYPTDFKISNSNFWSLNDSIYAVDTKAEGINVTSSVFVNVGRAVMWVTGVANAGRPQLVFTGNHVNSYSGCIELKGVLESVIANNLFYHNPGATSAQTCVLLTSTQAVNVHSNQFENFSSAATTGVSLAYDATYPAPPFDNVIANNIFGSQSSLYTQGIILNASAYQTRVSGNQFGGNISTRITDNTTLSPGQDNIYGRPVIVVKRANSNQSIPDAVPTLVSWDVVQYQTAGWGFTAPSTVVAIPASRSAVQIKCTANVAFEANVTGARSMQMLKNGVYDVPLPIVQANASQAPLTTDLQGSTGVLNVVAGDVISVQVAQNSSVPLNVIAQYTWLSCEMME